MQENTRIEKTNIAMPGFTTVWRYDRIALETGECNEHVSPHNFGYDRIVQEYEDQETAKRTKAAAIDHLLYFLEQPSMSFVEPKTLAEIAQNGSD